MKKLPLAIHCVLWCLLVLNPTHLLAASPNIVLSRALHFSAPDGTSVNLGPGKYYIEQTGPSELRLTPEGGKPGITIQAEPLTHEQYELFSAMALTRPHRDDEYLIELLLPGGIRLEARGSTKAPAKPPTIIKAPTPIPQVPIGLETEVPVSIPTPTPIPSQPLQEEQPISLPSPRDSSSPNNAQLYHAPNLSSQGTRVVVDQHESGKDPLYLSVLSPNHIGLTMFEQPALFWYIAQPTSQSVDVLITDEGNTQMLLDIRMLPPVQPGIHKIELKDYGIRLQANTTYQWKIILQGRLPGENHTTSGWIMRVSPPANVAKLTHLPSINATPVEPLVEAGLWYDAIWALSERLHTDPTDMLSLTQRANLFEQVGLLPPAQQDRQHAQKPSAFNSK
ncbi:MAG: DUF928 domain-containing protein [Nitrospirota bacterium]|nr:DUF928 domain-containing protein [Nitrospirota bacterium]